MALVKDRKNKNGVLRSSKKKADYYDNAQERTSDNEPINGNRDPCPGQKRKRDDVASK
jgi:hypothetical protein